MVGLNGLSATVPTKILLKLLSDLFVIDCEKSGINSVVELTQGEKCWDTHN